jgi:hypothetical protein
VSFSTLFTTWAMVGTFVATILLLSLPYFFGGMALAALFRRQHDEIPRLYMADLLGASAGVVVAVLAMNVMGTPAATFWVALPVLLAALLAGGRWRLIVPLFLVALMIWSGPFSSLEREREERAPVVYKHWDAMAKVKMYAFGVTYRGLNVDNVANSPVIPFDGDWDTWNAEEVDWDINVKYLVAQFDSCTFLSLGSGGGSDVMQALDHGATEVHAVEVNPHLNHMLVVGDTAGYVVRDSSVVDSTGRIITCAEFTGHVYQDSRVKVVSEDARTYVRRHKNTFDVIYSLSSNTWAALASGSFALAESYLFTTEAFMDYWDALSDSGFMSMEHQVYMPRLVTQVEDALTRLEVDDPRTHFAVYDLPGLRRKLVLISKRPLTDELRYLAYGPLTVERQGHIRLLYPAPDSLADNQINRIVTEGWRAMADSAKIDLSPATDDRPFVAQMGKWENFTWRRLEKVHWVAEFRGFPLAKIMIAVILIVMIVIVLPLNLFPYFRKGEKLRFVPWLYFFLIGAGFMMVEILLIQKYALFIGVSVYSLATVLFALLFASGLGSRVAPRWNGLTVFAGILVWLTLEASLFRPLTNELAGFPLSLRVITTIVLVFPLGFFMGMPFPKAGLRVGELVDWGFAVNGAASVLGATVVVLIAITQGFTVALLVAGALYALAGLLLSAKRAW